MVTKEQLTNGIINYIDCEVIPHLPTAGKWGVGTFVILANKRSNEIASQFTTSPMMETLGVVDCSSGQINIDSLAIAIKESAKKYGKLEIVLPVIGTLSFSDNDVDLIKEYIIGGNRNGR